MPSEKKPGILRGMATTTTPVSQKRVSKPKGKAPVRVGRPAARKYDRAAVVARLCARLANEAGLSLTRACAETVGGPTPQTVLEWLEDDPKLAEQYAHARTVGYQLMAEEIVNISDETHTMVEVEEKLANGTVRLVNVRVPLSPDVIARNRLRVDTRKWLLSKTLPKIYGDKVIQELTGKDGGPIQTVNQTMDLRGLSDAELEQMNALLAKAQPPAKG